MTMLPVDLAHDTASVVCRGQRGGNGRTVGPDDTVVIKARGEQNAHYHE